MLQSISLVLTSNCLGNVTAFLAYIMYSVPNVNLAFIDFAMCIDIATSKCIAKVINLAFIDFAVCIDIAILNA